MAWCMDIPCFERKQKKSACQHVYLFADSSWISSSTTSTVCVPDCPSGGTNMGVPCFEWKQKNQRVNNICALLLTHHQLARQQYRPFVFQLCIWWDRHGVIYYELLPRNNFLMILHVHPPTANTQERIFRSTVGKLFHIRLIALILLHLFRSLSHNTTFDESTLKIRRASTLIFCYQTNCQIVEMTNIIKYFDNVCLS